MEEVDLSDDNPPTQGSSSSCSRDNNAATSSSRPHSDVDESPDPRIQVELERLNTSTDTINKLEVDLDEARMLFRQLLTDSTHRIDMLAKRLGKCVEHSRPYYDARIYAKQALKETQSAAVRYERAVSQHAAAREMVFLAEEGLMQKGCTFDHTWQEMLNHATYKVNDSEREKIESAAEHRRTSALYHEAETRVKALQKELKRAIAKSSLNARRSLLQMNNLVRMHQLQLLPYFELKATVNQQLEAQKQQVRQLEESVGRAKMTYSQALANLETISDEIHRNRQSRLDLGVRGIGVGAESPLPPLQTVDGGGVPLAAHPLHYAESRVDVNTQEFRTLPGKLGPRAAPIMATTKSTATTTTTVPPSATTEITTTKLVTGAATIATTAVADEVSRTTTSYTMGAAPPAAASVVCVQQESKNTASPQQVTSSVKKDQEEKSRVVVEGGGGGGVVLEDLEGLATTTTTTTTITTTTDLTDSDWQVIESPALSPAAHYLTVDDRDSTVSDTESLASIEMLSDEAIAGLMLDEELAEASNSMCTPVTPVVDLPLPTFLQSWPAFLQNYATTAHESPQTVTSTAEAPSHSTTCTRGDDNIEGDSFRVSESLMKLNLDASQPPDTRRQPHHPPHSLALHRDSSSDQSSPEDLTPGYAPLRDASFSPEEFVPPSKPENIRCSIDSNVAPSPTSSSSSNETHQPHHSSWFLESESSAQKRP